MAAILFCTEIFGSQQTGGNIGNVMKEAPDFVERPRDDEFLMQLHAPARC